MIQEIGLFPHYTVAQNVGLVPHLENWDAAAHSRSRVDALLRQVGLDPEQFAARYPAQLSGGQRQRVGVARALAADPSVLLFDEPFGAVDPVTRLDLQKQFLALRRDLGKTAIFVTHDVREALMLATRIALLRDGKLELLATPRQFRNAAGHEALRLSGVPGLESGRAMNSGLAERDRATHTGASDAGAGLHGDRDCRWLCPPAF